LVQGCSPFVEEHVVTFGTIALFQVLLNNV